MKTHRQVVYNFRTIRLETSRIITSAMIFIFTVKFLKTLFKSKNLCKEILCRQKLTKQLKSTSISLLVYGYSKFECVNSNTITSLSE